MYWITFSYVTSAEIHQVYHLYYACLIWLFTFEVIKNVTGLFKILLLFKILSYSCYNRVFPITMSLCPPLPLPFGHLLGSSVSRQNRTAFLWCSTQTVPIIRWPARWVDQDCLSSLLFLRNKKSHFLKCQTIPFKMLTIIMKNLLKKKCDDHHVSSCRKPAEQPDGFGRGGWRGWRSPGGQQPHRAGLNLPQDKENKQTQNKRKTTPPPSFTSTTRVGRGAGLCFQRRAVSKKNPPHSPSLKSEQVSGRQNIFLSTAGTDCAKLWTLPMLNYCKIILF